MNNRERPAKKRKREVSKSHTGPGTNHKSPFESFRATERVEKNRKQQKLVNGSKLPKPNSKDRRRPLDQELIESGEDDAANDSDADGMISSAARLFSDLDIAPEVQRAIALMGFSDLKEIQRNLIPSILAGKDVSFSIASRITCPNLSTYRS